MAPERKTEEHIVPGTAEPAAENEHSAMEELELLRVKIHSIAAASHDLKNQLTALLCYVDLLKREPELSENAKTFIDVMERKGERISRELRYLLSASMGGSVPIQMRRVDLGQFLQSGLYEYSGMLQSRSLRVTALTDEAPVVLADRELLRRVMENLLNNVWHHAPVGSDLYCAAVKNEQWGEIRLRNAGGSRSAEADPGRSDGKSGYGLHIAHALCAVQGGSLISCSCGGSFRAIVRMPRAPPESGME